MVQKKVDYQALRSELEAIVADLQQSELDVDAALAKYQRGLELIKLLQTQLQKAENSIQKLQAQFDSKVA